MKFIMIVDIDDPEFEKDEFLDLEEELEEWSYNVQDGLGSVDAEEAIKEVLWNYYVTDEPASLSVSFVNTIQPTIGRRRPKFRLASNGTLVQLNVKP